jgi:hypothetical protein
MEAQTTVQIRITPSMMAEAFWNMGSEQQLEFFEHLATVIKEDHKTNTMAYSMGALQWYFLGDEMRTNKQARDMLMTMAAPLYLHTLNFVENQS